MKNLLTLLFVILSITGYAQINTFGGIGLRVNDTTTYQTNAAAYHTAGYYDWTFNNEATNDHWDIWNGASYTHVFGFVGTGNFVLSTSPALNGNPTAPTPTAGDDDTSIATTAFVQDKINENNVETVVHATDFSLALTDIYKKIQITNNSANTITIPTDGGGTDWEVGMWFYAEWYGGASGQSTFVPPGGGTIHSSSNTLVIPGQYSLVYCEYIGGDVWNLQNGSPATSWQPFTPTVVGFSGSPTYNFRYLYVPSEKRCTISFQMASATSNATTFTITTPITSAATYTQTTAAQVQNNGTFAVGVVSIPTTSTTITVSQASGAAWTSSGNKLANFTFTYETQ